MSKNEIWHIIVMILFAVVILTIFTGALWLGLKLGLSSQETMIKGVENGNYERF